MNLTGLREAVRKEMRGDSVDMSTLDESSRVALISWKDRHSGDLARHEPPTGPMLAWAADRPDR